MPTVEVTKPRVSFADLQQMPEDGRRYELYDGELYEMPGPIILHQVVANNLKRIVEDFSSIHGGVSLISPIDVVFSQYDVVEPDVLLYVQARRHLLNFRTAAHVAPDLAIEVLSPSSRSNDRGRKQRMFARYRVPEYWIADPDSSQLEVLTLQDDDYVVLQVASAEETVRSPLLAPFTFAVERAFRLP
jgi:Uma2 family endonuclease